MSELSKPKTVYSNLDSSYALIKGNLFNPVVNKLNALSSEDNALTVDTISEKTPGSGVTIDGVLIKDGGIALTPNVTLYTKEVNLTAANLIAMNGTPVTVVAALGTGYAFDFDSAVLIYDSTATAFTSGGAITINYSGGAAVSTTLAATFLTGAGDKVWNLQKVEGTVGFTMPVNTALVITNATGAFATGTGVCRLQITYRVHKTNL